MFEVILPPTIEHNYFMAGFWSYPVAWWAVRRYELSYWAASAPKKYFKKWFQWYCL